MPDRAAPHLETSAVTSAGSLDSMATSIGASTPSIPADPAALKSVGRYQIVRIIGSGGMGAVYEAIQDQPRRTVALKVMRSSLASPSLLRRFEYESQLLARLRHPGIAQVYDAGTHRSAETGEPVPFFAMEYIADAASLTNYARLRQLSTRDRLHLFERVCDAVHHGHLRGVIHRDLKPANILVDSTGQPKIIDFGVAYSADSEAAVVTQRTDQAPLVGTLQYMAPEQCATDARDIDARADVFALGLILYELLTEQPAYDLARKPLGAVLQIVREGRFAAPSQIVPALRGDLETIILKAAQPDRGQRYESAAALAADVTRYLKFEPILARPLGPVGRLSRWVRRNRAVAAVGTMSVLVLVIVSTLLIARIIVESRRAQRNLVAANENIALMKGIFGLMHPNELRGGLLDVKRLLDAAAQQLNAKAPDLPETEAGFREFLAESYRGVGLYDKSIEQQRRVVEIRQNILPDPSPELASSLHQLAAALWWNGQYDEAGDIYSRSLDMRRRLFGARHPDIATSLTHLAACRLRQSRLSEAESLYQQALDMRQGLRNTPQDQIAASINNLAKVIQVLGDFKRAEKLFRTAHSMITQAAGETDLQTASAAFNLATCLLEAGKPDEAKTFMRQSMDIRASKLQQGHHLLALARLGYARARFEESPSPEFLDAAVAALANVREALPPGHPDVAESEATLGRMHLHLGDLVQAEAALRRANASLDASTQTTAREHALVDASLAETLRRAGRLDEAEQLLIRTLARIERLADLAKLRAALESSLAQVRAARTSR